tara:strand:+ start:3010 stop:4188 length:1179 start_codon:yes stop_codon:yes gene_type:complete
MSEPAWWPIGIAISSFADAQSDGQIHTSFGRTNIWDYESLQSPEGWHTSPEDGFVWGQWETDIKTVETISITPQGLILLLNSTTVAVIHPLHTGDDVSRLSRYEPWKNALLNVPILLPIGGWSVDDNDRVLLFPMHSTTPFDGSESAFLEIVEALGAVHTSLEPFATPNTERRWNDRLKDIEDKLKTLTMWRAPHSSSTFGLPRLNLSVDSMVDVDGKRMFLPLSRSLSEHLLCESDRLPSLASLMMLEHQWARKEGLSEQQRQKLLDTWSKAVPSSWSSRNALSTVRGGAWVWRYHATILELAQAKAFNDEKSVKACEQWLRDVSRLQAHLGALRLWKSGQWVGVTGLAVAFFSWKLATLTEGQSLVLATLSIAAGIVTNAVYRLKDPKPY